MICCTKQIRIVQSPTINFIFFTISNLHYTVFVSLAHIPFPEKNELLPQNEGDLDAGS